MPELPETNRLYENEKPKSWRVQVAEEEDAEERWEAEDKFFALSRAADGALGEKPRPAGVGKIATYSGALYDFDNPDPAIINLNDIGHALSQMCRFAGHTKRFCSVAEHSVRVAHILRERGLGIGFQMLGLLHDAHEAYIWDCPRPLKPLLGNAFEEYADKADAAICEALFPPGEAFVMLSSLDSPRIKAADNIALVYEAKHLMPGGIDHWTEKYHDVPELPDGLDLVPPGVAPVVAKGMFLNECQELGLL